VNVASEVGVLCQFGQPERVEGAEKLTRCWRTDSAVDQELADSLVAAAGEVRDLAKA
jgi:hypothetical protein